MPRSADDILQFIDAFWKEKRHSPSMREIADRFETSTAVIDHYLLKLEREKRIMPRDPKLARTIVPIELAQAIEKFYESE